MIVAPGPEEYCPSQRRGTDNNSKQKKENKKGKKKGTCSAGRLLLF